MTVSNNGNRDNNISHNINCDSSSNNNGSNIIVYSSNISNYYGSINEELYRYHTTCGLYNFYKYPLLVMSCINIMLFVRAT